MTDHYLALRIIEHTERLTPELTIRELVASLCDVPLADTNAIITRVQRHRVAVRRAVGRFQQLHERRTNR